MVEKGMEATFNDRKGEGAKPRKSEKLIMQEPWNKRLEAWRRVATKMKSGESLTARKTSRSKKRGPRGY